MSRLRSPEPVWVPAPCRNPELEQELAGALGLPRALCAALRARGIDDPDVAKRHLRPRIEHLHPPEALADAERAAERLLRAAAEGETILVHGDYDVDGMSAAALYALWLRRLGASVEAFVPHRLRDGYDFGEAGLREAARVGAGVILTADCGTVAHEPVGRARAAGIDVIVTDHHTPSATLPPAFAVVNPNRSDCTYPEKGLSGAGVAFKLCQLLGRRAGAAPAELLPHLDLVALATIADLVPLTGENRVLVRFGLRALSTTRKAGLRALMDVVGVDGPVRPGQVGFAIAPRLNAAGRIGEAADALGLLLAEDGAAASSLASRLDAINRERQAEDRRTLEEALELLETSYDPDRDFGVVLASEGWHPGVIGIVASRVVERIHRPTVLVALDGPRGRGSARSIPGFHLHEALVACSGHLERFGGHRQAAGMDVRADALDGFRRAFGEVARERLAGEDLRPRLRIDAELGLDEVTPEVCRFIEYLGPHGIGNPRPLFVARGVELARPARVVGKNHLKASLARNGRPLDAIGFGLADRHPPEQLAGPLDVAYHVELNEYRGRARPQARVRALRAAS